MLLKDIQHTRYEIFDALIANNISFAVYRLPNHTNIELVLSETNKSCKIKSLIELSTVTGFVIAPFKPSNNNPIIYIRPEEKIEGEKKIFAFLGKYKSITSINKAGNSEAIANKENNTYQCIFDHFVNSLKTEQLDKLVLSRTKSVYRKSSFSAGRSFKATADKYSNNFVYLCYTPETGAWLGSTPEMILSGENKNWKTVALAGTKHVDDRNTKWDKKNVEEQKIVIDYVKQQLKKANCNFSKTPTTTIQAGNVIHLKSDFLLHLPAKPQIGELLYLLHPTPAVCGYPKEEAYNFILKNEGYDRRYYSGFIGYLDINDKTDLYVNLRCMEIKEKELLLYAGGGILPTSNLETESEEIENKLETMLSIIQE